MTKKIKVLDGILRKLYEGKIVSANLLLEFMDVPLKKNQRINLVELNQQFEYYAYIIDQHCGKMVRNGYYYNLVKDYRTSYFYHKGGFEKNITLGDM